MANKKTTAAAKDKDKELIELGKKLQAFYEAGYVSKKQALFWALLKGAAGGVGAILGSTVVIALLLWILSFFNQLPFVESINEALKAATHK